MDFTLKVIGGDIKAIPGLSDAIEVCQTSTVGLPLSLSYSQALNDMVSGNVGRYFVSVSLLHIGRHCSFLDNNLGLYLHATYTVLCNEFLLCTCAYVVTGV